MCRHTFLQSLISVNYCKVTIPAPYLQEQRHIYSILADRRAQKSPAPTPYHNAKTSKAMPQHAPLRFCITNKLCGKDGIRTRDTLLTYTRFPGVPLQPLEHLSLLLINLPAKVQQRNESTYTRWRNSVVRISVTSEPHMSYLSIFFIGGIPLSPSYSLFL